MKLFFLLLSLLILLPYLTIAQRSENPKTTVFNNNQTIDSIYNVNKSDDFNLFYTTDSIKNNSQHINSSVETPYDSIQSIRTSLSDTINNINQLAGCRFDVTPLPELPKASLETPQLSQPDFLSQKPSDLLPDEVGEKLNRVKKLEVENLKNPEAIDALTNTQASRLSELGELQHQTGQATSSVDQVKDAMQIGEHVNTLNNERAMEKMGELFAQHGDKLDAAQQQMNQLKKKYSFVPNSNDLRSAVKINSLENEPLKKRLIVGANLKFENGNPLILDVAPLVMYKFTKVFHAGLSGSYRASLNYDEKNYSATPEDVVGASALARYFVLKSFFAYSELEYKSSTHSYDGKTWNSISTRKWVPAGLLGIGKEMSLSGKLKGTIILTYDLLHSDKSYTKSPWNIKVGFHLDGLDLKRN